MLVADIKADTASERRWLSAIRENAFLFLFHLPSRPDAGPRFCFWRARGKTSGDDFLARIGKLGIDFSDIRE